MNVFEQIRPVRVSLNSYVSAVDTAFLFGCLEILRLCLLSHETTA